MNILRNIGITSIVKIKRKLYNSVQNTQYEKTKNKNLIKTMEKKKGEKFNGRQQIRDEHNSTKYTLMKVKKIIF